MKAGSSRSTRQQICARLCPVSSWRSSRSIGSPTSVLARRRELPICSCRRARASPIAAERAVERSAAAHVGLNGRDRLRRPAVTESLEDVIRRSREGTHETPTDHFFPWSGRSPVAMAQTGAATMTWMTPSQRIEARHRREARWRQTTFERLKAARGAGASSLRRLRVTCARLTSTNSACPTPEAAFRDLPRHSGPQAVANRSAMPISRARRKRSPVPDRAERAAGRIARRRGDLNSKSQDSSSVTTARAALDVVHPGEWRARTRT